jgi:phospholipid transport system substrate-binding protein
MKVLSVTSQTATSNKTGGHRATGRRFILGSSVLSAGLLSLGTSSRAAANDRELAQAAQFIRDAGNRLGALSRGNPSPEEKRRRLQAFLEDVVDVDGVAQFCLGRFWRVATPAQQQEYLQLFRQVLVNTVSPHIKEYPQDGGGIQVAISQGVRNGSLIDVSTQVSGNSESGEPFRVTWVLGTDTGRLRIVDIVSEGMSLRTTQRSDYAAFLNRHDGNVAALIQALREQMRVNGR